MKTKIFDHFAQQQYPAVVTALCIKAIIMRCMTNWKLVHFLLVLLVTTLVTSNTTSTTLGFSTTLTYMN